MSPCKLQACQNDSRAALGDDIDFVSRIDLVRALLVAAGLLDKIYLLGETRFGDSLRRLREAFAVVPLVDDSRSNSPWLIQFSSTLTATSDELLRDITAAPEANRVQVVLDRMNQQINTALTANPLAAAQAIIFRDPSD
jgi:hypothetical protein